jgi:hypothetical protein
MLRILVIFPSGGVYEEAVPENSQIIADLGLSDEDLEILRRGEDIFVLWGEFFREERYANHKTMHN